VATTGDDAREGLTACSPSKCRPEIFIADQGQAGVLGSKAVVESAMNEKLSEFLLEFPAEARAISARSSMPHAPVKPPAKPRDDPP